MVMKKRWISVLLVVFVFALVVMPGFAADKTVNIVSTLTRSGVKLEFSEKDTYSIYMKAPGATWQLLGKKTTAAYTVSKDKLISGTRYQFSAVKPSDSTSNAQLAANAVTVNYIQIPVIKTVTVLSKSSVKLTWQGSNGAKTYKIYYKAPDGAWKTHGYSTQTTYTVTNLNPNTNYSFLVRCVSEDRKSLISANSLEASAKTWVEAPKIMSGTVVSGNKVALSWSKTKDTSKYAAYTRKVGETTWTKVSETSALSLVTKSLSSGATYEYSIRSLDQNGKLISGYAAKKTVKINKDYARYIVTCNINYTNSANTLGRYYSKADAVAAINKQSASKRGQWFVCDTANKMAVVYPELKTKSQKLKAAVEWAKAIAADSRHGYSCVGECSDSNTRTSLGRWGKDGDYSCSTLVASAYEMVGLVNLREVANQYHLRCNANGRYYTNSINSSDFAEACMKSGKFKDITSQYKANGKAALQPGDILITKSKGHVVLYVGNGNMAEAAMNELGREYATPKAGDQTGKEIRVKGLSGSWGTVLRYKG